MEEPLKNGLRQRAILGSSIVLPQRQAVPADLRKFLPSLSPCDSPPQRQAVPADLLNGDIRGALFF